MILAIARRPAICAAMALIGSGLAPLGSALAAPPDIAVLAAPCASCHGPDGVSPGEIPSIAGRDQAELLSQMLAFREGPSDPRATIMPRLLKGYTPAEIDQLAAYFAGLPQ